MTAGRYAMVAGVLATSGRLQAEPPGTATPRSLIETVQHEVLWQGRDGTAPSWFHPRACTVPTPGGLACVMTLQRISGSDVFHPVHWTRSDDGGRTWRAPEPIPGFGRQRRDDGSEEGVCDVVPEYHPLSGRVIAMGHNVYYRDGKLTQPATDRFPVYVVGDLDGNWSERRRLQWTDPRATAIYTSNCGQRVSLANGDVLVPVSFGPLGRTDRAAGTLLCAFDGQILTVKAATRNELRCRAGRGLLEPSLTHFGGSYYLTLRAEDNRGYVAVSQDGIEWADMRPWAWEDGTPLAMSSTQQHWVTHSDGLFLAYTRKTDTNAGVVRWRAPVFMAQVDPERRCLIRSSEAVILPLRGEPAVAPKHVALMGNFNVTPAGPLETWITVGESRPQDGWRGDTLLARVVWRDPNRLAEAIRPQAAP